MQNCHYRINDGVQLKEPTLRLSNEIGSERMKLLICASARAEIVMKCLREFERGNDIVIVAPSGVGHTLQETEDIGQATLIQLKSRNFCKESRAELRPLRLTGSFSSLVADNPGCPSSCQSDDEVTQWCLDSLLVKFIPHLCHSEDTNFMNFSVAVRMPFLDYRIVEFVLALDSS